MLRCKCPRLAVCHMQKTMVVMSLGSRWPTLLMQIALPVMWWNAAVRCVWDWICVVRAHLAVQAELVVKLRLICFQDRCSVDQYGTLCIPMTCDHNQICNYNCTKSVCAYVCTVVYCCVAYKMFSVYKQVLYAADKGQDGQYVLQSIVN